MNEHEFLSLLNRLGAEAKLNSFVWQLLALLVALLGAWVLHRLNHRRVVNHNALGQAHLDNNSSQLRQLPQLRMEAQTRLIFPVSAWLICSVCVLVLRHTTGHTSLLQISAVLLGALAAVRLVVYVLRTASDNSFVRAFERWITVIIYAAAVAYLTNLLEPVIDWLDSINITLGKAKFTMLALAQGALVVSATILAALWIGAWIESRLASAQDVDSSTRTVIARFVRALLFVLAILIGLTAAGLDLTVLGVFGGALGVGLGLGLQRIASNYVSGFIVLLDRGLRIGDTITVDKYQGTVTAIRTRYTLIKAVDGTEAIIPNETLITSPVLNHSLTDPKIRHSIRVRVAPGTDLGRAFELMRHAAALQPAVMADPAPYAYLAELATDGLVLELTIWVADPRLVKTEIRAEILLEIVHQFAQHAIVIPFAQPLVYGSNPAPTPVK